MGKPRNVHTTGSVTPGRGGDAAGFACPHRQTLSLSCSGEPILDPSRSCDQTLGFSRTGWQAFCFPCPYGEALDLSCSERSPPGWNDSVLGCPCSGKGPIRGSIERPSQAARGPLSSASSDRAAVHDSPAGVRPNPVDEFAWMAHVPHG